METWVHPVLTDFVSLTYSVTVNPSVPLSIYAFVYTLFISSDAELSIQIPPTTLPHLFTLFLLRKRVLQL